MENKKAPIIEDGKTLDELVANCPTAIREVATGRAMGQADEAIWASMKEQ